MKAYLSRLFIAFWFVGMVAFAVWGLPAYGEGVEIKFFPIIARHAPFLENPPLHNYRGLGTVYASGSKIFTLRADGSDRQVLTEGESIDYAPLWSPNSRRIAFLRYTYNDLYPYHAFVMNSDGSDLRPIADNPTSAYNDSDLTWTPNGQYLVTGRNAQSDGGKGRLLAVDVTTQEKFTLTDALIIAPNHCLLGQCSGWSVSPTGRELFYLADASPLGRAPVLWITTIPDGEARLVREDVSRVAWSLDGQQLVVEQPNATQGDETVLLNRDGSVVRMLYTAPYAFFGWLDRGNQQLLYNRENYQFYRFDMATSAIVPLTEGGVPALIGISPQGNQILYKLEQDNTLYLQSTDDSPVRVIPNPNCEPTFCYVGGPTWADDGSGLMFVNTYPDRATFYTAYYLSLATPDATAHPIPGASPGGGVSFLPFSSTHAMSQSLHRAYPAPMGSSVSAIDIPLTSVESLGSGYITEWRYLP